MGPQRDSMVDRRQGRALGLLALSWCELLSKDMPAQMGFAKYSHEQPDPRLHFSHSRILSSGKFSQVDAMISSTWGSRQEKAKR